MIVGIMAAALLGLAWIMRLPGRVVAAMLALLWLGVVMAHLLLPGGHALRVAIGGSAAGWLVLGGGAALVLAYRQGLAWLRRRVDGNAVAPTPAARAFSGAELDRYARHIVLREVGGPGQRRLRDARVLVVGAGGLGAPALIYLAAAGVGTIGVVDDDTVSVSNLQRQVIHTDARIGRPKVQSAVLTLAALNPHVTVRPHQHRLDAGNAPALFAEYDLILDGSDNFATRALVNAAAVAGGKPLIAAAVTQWEGQISLYDPARGGPCFACIFPEAPAPGLAPACAEAGVVGALPGVIGSMMALEAIKLITGAGQTLRGRMLIYDGLFGENRVIGLKPRADCPVCGGLHRLDTPAGGH